MFVRVETRISRSGKCVVTLVLLSALGSLVQGQAAEGGDPADSQVPLAEARSCDAVSILPNILDDQKDIWTFPAHAVRGRHLWPTLGVLAVTGALIAADPHDSSYFHHTSTFSSFNSAFNGTATAIGIAAAPVSFYVAGLARSDSKAKTTGWLAGESLADAEIVAYALKTADQRLKPAGFGRRANLSDNWLDAKGSVLGANGSFPSGHAIGAFAVATVVSRRYREHRWMPFAAYGLAGAIGFSRLTNSAHYPADVLFGAVLGYSISRFAVLRD